MTYRHAKRDLLTGAFFAAAVVLAIAGCDDSAKHTTAQTRVPNTRPAPQTASASTTAIPTGNPPFLLPKLPLSAPSHAQIVFVRAQQKPLVVPVNNEGLIARVEEKFASGQ
ncbi:MAG: hypothetical protein JO260_06385, partial [Acidobacteria bacterium]|nr:hypothetical protein [Acidobacteriota bacterium]